MTQASYSRIRRKMLRASANLAKIRAAALSEAEALGAEECRRKLAEWAAQPGRTQAELDELNELNKMDS